MSALYSRILLWHKLVAMRTGALALCSAKRALNPAEARDWVDGLRAVADDIEQFLNEGTFILDDRGQRVVKSPETNLGGPHHVSSQPDTNPVRSGATDRKVGGLRVAKRKTK